MGWGLGRHRSRLYNLPFETLRRSAKNIVSVDCRSGPSTVLTGEEEEQLYI